MKLLLLNVLQTVERYGCENDDTFNNELEVRIDTKDSQ